MARQSTVSDAPIPEISGDQQQQAARHSMFREILVWTLILATVAFVVYRNSHVDMGSDFGLLRQATARFRVMTLIETVSIQKQLGAAGDKRFADQAQMGIRMIDDEAVTPEDMFQAVISAGEILGKDEALSRLERIGPNADPELLVDMSAARTIYENGPGSLTAEDRDRLIRRHGDFGKIALAFGRPKDEEPRKSIEATAARLFFAATAVAGAVLFFAAAAVACCITGFLLLVRKKLHRAYVRRPPTDIILLEAFAVYLIAFVSFGWVVRFFGLQSLAWNWLVAVLVAILLLWIRKRGGILQLAWQSAGLNRGRGWWREIAAGLMGYMAGMVVIVPGLLITYLLARRTGVSVGHPIMRSLLSGSAWEILGVYGLACILAPVTEEMMFRGAVFGHLRRRWNWFVSAGIASFIFAILHPQGWTAVPALGAIALVLAGIREWRDSLIASTAAHAFNNFVAITFALLLLRQ